MALFRCISCKYRFDADPSYGDSMGAVGRVYHYGQVWSLLAGIPSI